ncbi:glycosyltransferase family 4 protein [Siminovitchia sp. FSL H7-0308]|uniref:glycosyltransferase family 4 protein n=1 Tax=Siminovitchia sp. FSL H7-0308 TaxID=2921432 RepID=UPI0030EB7ACC
MDNIIVYFPFKLSANPKSGSGIRPKKMVEAFQALGQDKNLEIIIVAGNSSKRKEQIKEFIHSGKVQKTLFCYMENSTMPYWLTDEDHIPRHPFIDYYFLKYLKRNHVPIGLFYRDIYWKFKELYSLEGVKKVLTPLIRKIYQFELSRFYNVVDVLYLPSLEMNKYVGWDGEVQVLPPGIDRMKVLSNPNINDRVNLIYIGGISERYGIKTLIDAMEILQKKKKQVHLYLICRKAEYEQNKLLKEKADNDWITIEHLSGEELLQVCKKAHIGMIPIQKNSYHDFAVPVKLFEYLSFGLPLVVTDCSAQTRIVREGGYGLVAKDSADELAQSILNIAQENNYIEYKNNILQNAFKNHSWYARVAKVYADLSKEKK